MGYTGRTFTENIGTENIGTGNPGTITALWGVEPRIMSIQQETQFDLGPESGFTKFPKLISLGEENYYLVSGKRGYLLLSTICPHQGSVVSNEGKVFMCPNHGWRFEHTQGECINGPRSRMRSYPVTVQDGRLIADLA